MSARSPAPWWSLHSPSPGAPPPRPTCHSPAAWAAWGFQDRTGPQAGGGADTGRPPPGGPRGRQEGLLRSLEALSWARCRKPLHFQAGVGYGFPSQAQCHPRQGPALTPPQGQRGGQTGHVQAGALWSLLPPPGSRGGGGRGGPGGGGRPRKAPVYGQVGGEALAGAEEKATSRPRAARSWSTPEWGWRGGWPRDWPRRPHSPRGPDAVPGLVLPLGSGSRPSPGRTSDPTHHTKHLPLLFRLQGPPLL